MDNLSGQIGKLEEIDVLIKAQEKGANSGTEKVVLSDEILEYAKVALARVQEKLRMGEQIYERDLEFVEQVYSWMKQMK
ncbi:hypothetical protein GF340_00050 [Candidatus Peregrinibacteria bacterium]|nr:hypothetical protein [Candidatus Peregrinibacteria bacterium]